MCTISNSREKWRTELNMAGKDQANAKTQNKCQSVKI